MSWFRKFVDRVMGLVLQRRAGVPIAAPADWKPGAPEWTAANATEWRKFLTTDTGRTLMLRARAQECSLAITAQQSAAAGNPVIYTFSDAVNWLDSLSQVTGDQVTKYEAPTEAEPETLETPSA